jgi:hypothetical protein
MSQSAYDMDQVGGFVANGSWVRVGDVVFRDEPRLGYRLPVKVVGAASNGQQTWASVEYQERVAALGTDVEMCVDRLHQAADGCP